ncbi:hypothetical protein BXZ70DRAFT_240010 [Cristinia sonorae]|uniref:N-acetyltransferase domain-containing protein n=1 Tax=Cristinia sonorae TaxID=1940300 RepID=A0A8K0ULB9_9AGAR|nr:hypothetical protein BXZ70DRAFT_240010 [Cristinia sonorae]
MLDVSGLDMPPRFEFWSKLFDKHGFVKRELVRHEHHKGSGCWGWELNQGMLVYVDVVWVDPPYRRQGVGSLMLRRLLESKHIEPFDFLVACETPTQDPHSHDHSSEIRRRHMGFLHRNHFRRLGRTPFLLCSAISNHPSRKRLVLNEPLSNLEYEDKSDPVDPLELLFPGMRDPDAVSRNAAKYPIHEAIGRILDRDVVYTPLGEEISISTFIQQQFVRDPSSLHVRNRKGYTPLHAAAAHKNLTAVQALLQPQYKCQADLSRRDNVEGATPLEILMLVLQKEREVTESSGKSWWGYPERPLKVAWTLKRADGLDIGTLSQFVVKSRWGCTCGHCTSGWFSPLMRRSMACFASSLSSKMQASKSTMRGHVAQVDLVGLKYLPLRIRNATTLAGYEGFLAVVRGVEAVCRTADQIPTPLVVLQASAGLGDISEYVDLGGRAEYALDIVLHAAQSLSPLGDGTFGEGTFEDVTEDLEDVLCLPPCENDLEFVLVRRHLRLCDIAGPHHEHGM